MKCLLRKLGRCAITDKQCNNPVELGDEDTCEVYQKEFHKWFEGFVVEEAYNTVECWYQNSRGPVTRFACRELSREFPHILIQDIELALKGRGLPKSLFPEDDEIMRILRKYHVDLVKDR